MATRDLTDKVIVITGASAGIGAATAIEAARAGMHVVVSARRAERLEQVAEQVRRLGRQALVVPADVADDEQVVHLAERTMETFERLDVMFANAGYGYLTGTASMDRGQERRMWEVNYFGTMRCVRAALPIMQTQKSGHLVITSSIVGRIGLPYYTAYSASKSAQDTMAMGLRLEVEPFGIDVTVVFPVGTRTEFFEVSKSIGGYDTIVENTPKGFMQMPDHVARRVVAALRRPRMEVWPNRLSRYGAGLGLLLPRLTRRALRKHANRDREVLGELGRPLY